MVFYTVPLLFYYICVGFLMPKIAESKDIVTAPSSLNTEMEQQKIIAITTAMNELSEVLKDSEAIETNLDKLLNNSKIMGIIVNQGLPYDETKNLTENKNMRQAAYDLSESFYVNQWYIDKSFSKIINKHVDKVGGLTQNISWIWKTNELKDYCRGNDWVEIFEALQYSLELFRNGTIDEKGISETNTKNMYQKLMKKMFILSTFCETLCDGPETSEMANARRTTFQKITKNINNNLPAIIAEKDTNWWSKIVRKSVLSEVSYTMKSNDFVAMEFHSLMTSSYSRMDYEYHVGVSDATSGFNNAVTYCSPGRCHHFENFRNKNIYILRNKIYSNGYQKCKYLDSFNDKECINNAKFGDLRDLANHIIKKCNVSAVSLVKDGLNYEKHQTDGNNYFTTGTFNFPCFGVVNVAVANYPN